MLSQLLIERYLPHAGRIGTVGRISTKGAVAVAAKEFFDSLESRADASKLAGMNNSYLFDIEGEGQWLVSVADGKLSVTEGGGRRRRDDQRPRARRSRRSSPASRTRRRPT